MKLLSLLLPALFLLSGPAPVRPAAEELNGFVVTRGGQFVAGASVWQRDRPSNATSTNAEGQFILPRPAEASFYLRVEAPGFVIQDQLVTDTTTQPVRIKLFPLVRGPRR
ncbi:carboxypeptidase-like regulatory domain-containing protein [Hymenobacter sp.]|uniref:carboxypeptidase-like regulatory domain-containing protein n=1 Tax=Hymenobacter sp. TaxID=1898978 RepID=UPI00286BCD35|nr:carboxypeptidase-like regulatory domain-containing protein [Hymenobacter sp.]